MDQVTQPAWKKFWKIFISSNLRASNITPDPACIWADQYWYEENKMSE